MQKVPQGNPGKGRSPRETSKRRQKWPEKTHHLHAEYKESKRPTLQGLLPKAGGLAIALGNAANRKK